MDRTVLRSGEDYMEESSALFQYLRHALQQRNESQAMQEQRATEASDQRRANTEPEKVWW